MQVVPAGASPLERLRKRSSLLAVSGAWPRYIAGADSPEDERDGVIELSIRDLLLKGIPQ